METTGKYTVEGRGKGKDRVFVTLNPAGTVIFASVLKRDAQASADFHNEGGNPAIGVGK